MMLLRLSDSAGQDFTPDLLLSQSTNQNVVEVDMQVIEEDTVDEDDQDSSTSEDPTEEINNDDQVRKYYRFSLSSLE